MKCGANGTGYRFTNKAVNENERRLIQNYWIEMTQLYGTYTDFYTYDYSTSAHDFFYGEHPLAPFSGPTPMVMLAQFNNDSLLLLLAILLPLIAGSLRLMLLVIRLSLLVLSLSLLILISRSGITLGKNS